MMVLEVDSTQDLLVEVFPKILDRVFEVFKQWLRAFAIAPCGLQA